MYHDPLFIKIYYLCETTDKPLLWRNYNGVFDQLYVFYCVVSRNFLYTFYFWSGKKYCCTAVCEHGSFSWFVSSWADKNEAGKKMRAFLKTLRRTIGYHLPLPSLFSR